MHVRCAERLCLVRVGDISCRSSCDDGIPATESGGVPSAQGYLTTANPETGHESADRTNGNPAERRVPVPEPQSEDFRA
jgi:hypothetical protein